MDNRFGSIERHTDFPRNNWQKLVGISVPHMSHIETGNTKLSLPVFVSLADALGVQTDDLLCQTPSGRTIACQELAELVERCSTQQLRIITDIAKAAKISLDKYETLN